MQTVKTSEAAASDRVICEEERGELVRETPPTLEKSSDKVNLCGAVTLSEVKDLIREWISSCEGETLIERETER